MRESQEKISIWSFWMVISISIIALAGWIANALSLAGMGKNSIPMAPVTIICFLLSSFAALYLLRKRINTILVKVTLYTVIVFCLIVLVDISTGYSIEFERIFGNSTKPFNNLPIGRMSPITSMLFLVCAISLLIISTKNKWHKIATILSTIALLVVFTFDLGYLYGTPLLYGKSIIPPAWNTSLAFTFLFMGLLSGFCMNDKPLNLFIGESLRARLMRGFLPLPLLIIIVAGWIDTIFIKIFNDHVLISSLITIFSLFLLSFIILRLAKKIGNEVDHIFAFRKETEEKLRESELHFRTLADSGQALIWTSGTDKKCNFFNQPWLDFTGRRIEQELGDGWVEGVYPDDLDRCFRIYSEAFDRQERFSMDYRLRYRDGSYRWIQDNGTPRFNISGEFIGYIGHCLDIAERKSAEVALAESEERYRLISSVATDYTFSTKVLPDGSLDLNWVAGAFESISGYSVEEFKAFGAWRATVHPDDFNIDDNDITRLRNNQDTESEIRTINRNGEIVWVQVFAHPIWDDKKNCLSGIYGAVKNITDRKNAEEKLINSELRFRELLEKVNLIAVILDTEGKVSFGNDYLLELTGFKSEELIGQNWFDLMIPEKNSGVKEVFLDGIKKGDVAPRFENPILTKSGKKLDIVWSNVVQRNHKGQIMGIASIGEDITERKLAENNLHETNERLKLMLENTPNAIWDWNLETDIWLTTSKYYTMLGYEPETGISDRKVWLNRIHPNDRENVIQKINCVLSFQNLEYTYTARMLHANGTYRWQTVIGHVIEKDESGKARRMLGIRMDVDEIKKAEEALRKLNLELEQKIAERTLELKNRSRTLEEKEIVLTNTIKNLNLKSEELQNSAQLLEATNKELEAFSYSVSHDLRAPLRAINGFVNILNEEYNNVLDDEGKRICSIIHSNAVKMGQLIDDLLSFSRLIRSELHHSRIDMQNVVSNLIDEFELSKEINSDIISVQELPISTGDTNLIKQVWMNLISNAIKYSSKTTYPQIIIGATQNKNETIYFIKDNGVGFNMCYSHKLFGVFQRLHGANEFEGTGVGLAIVQRIVSRHGGRVWAEGEIEKGATFYFTLPIKNIEN